MSLQGCRLSLDLVQGQALTSLQMNQQRTLQGKVAVWAEQCELTECVVCICAASDQ